MAACVIRNMESIPEEARSYNSPKRKRSLNVNMPRTTLSEEERHLGIYEDDVDCADLSDSDDDDNYYNYEEEDYKTGNHGNGLNTEHSKVQKLDLSSFVVPSLNFKTGKNEVPPKYSESLDVNISGARGKAITPTNTEYSEISEIRDIDSGKNSRIGVESREAVYKKAMDLMTVRCTSVQGNNVEERNINTPLLCVKNQPYGTALPKYFYVQQNRPLPMPPLKAWRGYNGNVYFEPMQVSQVRCAQPERQTPDIEKCSEKLKKILEPRFKSPESSQAQSTRPSTRGEKSSKTLNDPDSGAETQTQMSVSISDKKAILSRLNQKMREEEYWPEPQETVGSLKVDSNGAGKNKQVKNNKGKPRYQKDKICKGSVAHKVAAQKKSQPFFSVNGGKYVAPTTMSPLLRTQTQYSQSNQRQGMNTPDLLNTGAYEKLPPLEQLRASLRHMENSSDKSVVVVPPNAAKGQSQRGKPAYVKYSHDQYSHKQVSRT